jgi:hypothetical protein
METNSGIYHHVTIEHELHNHSDYKDSIRISLAVLIDVETRRSTSCFNHLESSAMEDVPPRQHVGKSLLCFLAY